MGQTHFCLTFLVYSLAGLINLLFSCLLFHWHYWLVTLLFNIIYLFWFKLILCWRIFYRIFKRRSLPLVFSSAKYSVFFVCLLFIYSIYLFTCLSICLLLLLSILLLFSVIIITNTNFFGYTLYLTYASKVRGASIIVPYGDH